MKKIALDTNIAIAVLNESPEIINKLYALRSNDTNLYLSITVCGELLYGAKNSKRKSSNLSKYRTFISKYNILGIDFQVAEVYSSLRKILKDTGNPIPENHIWIAATCLNQDIPLFTLDKHFQKINELTLIGR